jgi:hypothetical protein
MHANSGLRSVAILDVVIPGIDPWKKVLSNPQIWHFAMHAIPDLPERLVQGNQRAYFDYFFDVLSARKESIDDETRESSVKAYASNEALTAGFDWYRAFGRDAERNAARDREQTSIGAGFASSASRQTSSAGRSRAPRTRSRRGGDINWNFGKCPTPPS